MWCKFVGAGVLFVTVGYIFLKVCREVRLQSRRLGAWIAFFRYAEETLAVSAPGFPTLTRGTGENVRTLCGFLAGDGCEEIVRAAGKTLPPSGAEAVAACCLAPALSREEQKLRCAVAVRQLTRLYEETGAAWQRNRPAVLGLPLCAVGAVLLILW